MELVSILYKILIALSVVTTVIISVAIISLIIRKPREDKISKTTNYNRVNSTRRNESQLPIEKKEPIYRSSHPKENRTKPKISNVNDREKNGEKDRYNNVVRVAKKKGISDVKRYTIENEADGTPPTIILCPNCDTKIKVL